MWFLIWAFSRMMSKPPTRPSPLVGSNRPLSIRMVVDLPAPLGPRKPKISPRLTSKLMLSTAMKSPKCRERFLTTMAFRLGIAQITL